MIRLIRCEASLTTPMITKVILWGLIVTPISIANVGCAEGPFWRTGRFSPWATQKWQEEEDLADTLFAQKKEMNALVANAAGQSSTVQNKAAQKLAQIALRNPILLVRLQAVRKLGELNCPDSRQALTQAYRDPDPEVRLMVVEAWRKMPAEEAVPKLHDILGSDTNVDVRLAATRALGDFSGSPSIAALQLALSDPNPAIQLRATQAMARASGESFGANVKAWQRYAKEMVGDGAQRVATEPATTLPR